MPSSLASTSIYGGTEKWHCTYSSGTVRTPSITPVIDKNLDIDYNKGHLQTHTSLAHQLHQVEHAMPLVDTTHFIFAKTSNGNLLQLVSASCPVMLCRSASTARETLMLSEDVEE